jgi:hypothetical protein
MAKIGNVIKLWAKDYHNHSLKSLKEIEAGLYQLFVEKQAGSLNKEEEVELGVLL